MKEIWKDEGYRLFVIKNFIDDIFNNRTLYDDVYDNAINDLVENYPEIQQLLFILLVDEVLVGVQQNTG